jgi:hypothetical protein
MIGAAPSNRNPRLARHKIIRERMNESDDKVTPHVKYLETKTRNPRLRIARVLFGLLKFDWFDGTSSAKPVFGSLDGFRTRHRNHPNLKKQPQDLGGNAIALAPVTTCGIETDGWVE